MSSALEANVTSLRDDDSLYEIVNGQRVELPPMGIDSTLVANNLYGEMFIYLKKNKVGRAVSDALFILEEEPLQKRRPDVAFVSTDRWPLDRPIPTEGDWDVVPDVAIEVISPHDIFNNVLTKVGEYFDFGVETVCVIAPIDQSVYIYESADRVRLLGRNDVLELPKHLPGWSLPLKQLFAR